MMPLHDRPLCCPPRPQVTEQWVHSDHGDQPSPLSLGKKRSDSVGITSITLQVRTLPHSCQQIKLTETDRAALSVNKGWIDAGHRRARHLLTHHLSILNKVIERHTRTILVILSYLSQMLLLDASPCIGMVCCHDSKLMIFYKEKQTRRGR